MKIAVVCRFPKLSETFIVNQITGLLDLGHDVHIFATKFYPEGIKHRDVESYRLLERVRPIQPDLSKSRIVRLLKSAALLVGLFVRRPKTAAKVLSVFLKEHEQVGLLGFLHFVLPFIKGDYDIIQCHFGPNGVRCLPIKKIGLRSRLVTTFHGFDVTTSVREGGAGIYSELFRMGDLFTYNSEATKAKLLALGCPPDRMAKLPMGIYLDRIEFRARTPGPGNRINVLSVGRLVEMKGREYAIRAMAAIVRQFPHVTYSIAGDGPLRADLQRLINELGVEDAIKLYGWVSSEELDNLYITSHIFLHPSITASNGNMEGQGVVLAEAQAHGMPVIATKHNAFPDSIRDGLSGFLVPEKDVDALVAKLRYLIEHPEIWPEMGRCGRKFVEESFDSRILNARLEQICAGLLSPAVAPKADFHRKEDR